MAADDIQTQLIKYLQDAHSTEENAISQLKAGAESVSDENFAETLRQHLSETEEHERLIRERLEAYEESPSKLKDMAQKGAAAMTGAMAGAAPDTTGKIAIQVYAFEHLEIATYRSLRTVAERAGDQQTVQVAERILAQEEAAAQKVDGLLEQAALVGLPQSAAA
jgi:ferritin-like metal-binding protein YciE